MPASWHPCAVSFFLLFPSSLWLLCMAGGCGISLLPTKFVWFVWWSHKGGGRWPSLGLSPHDLWISGQIVIQLQAGKGMGKQSRFSDLLFLSCSIGKLQQLTMRGNNSEQGFSSRTQNAIPTCHLFPAVSNSCSLLSLTWSILPFTALLYFWPILLYHFRIHLAASLVFYVCPVLTFTVTTAPSIGIAPYVDSLHHPRWYTPYVQST